MFKHELFDSVEFERVEIDGKRHYKVPGGNTYKSVTTALGVLNADAIQAWRKRVGEDVANTTSSRAAARGTSMHAICENYMLNRPEYLKRSNGKAFMPNHIEMFNRLKPYLDQYVDEVYGIELRMYSDELQLAGTCDCVCRMHGVPTIVDFKTASKPKQTHQILNYFLQAAAYSIMVKERYGKRIDHIAILVSTEHEGGQVFWKRVEPYEEMLRYFMKFGELPQIAKKFCKKPESSEELDYIAI